MRSQNKGNGNVSEHERAVKEIEKWGDGKAGKIAMRRWMKTGKMSAGEVLDKLEEIDYEFESLKEVLVDNAMTKERFALLHEASPGFSGAPARVAVSAIGYRILMEKHKKWGCIRWEQESENIAKAGEPTNMVSITVGYARRNDQDFDHRFEYASFDCLSLGRVHQKHMRIAQINRATTNIARTIYPELYACLGMSAEEQVEADADNAGDAVSHSVGASKRSGPKEVPESDGEGGRGEPVSRSNLCAS